MDEETRSRPKTRIPPLFWLGLGLFVLGIVVGAYLSPFLDPFFNAERAAMVQNSQTIQNQNALLKEQVDCLVNGINQNHGKKTVDECT